MAATLDDVSVRRSEMDRALSEDNSSARRSMPEKEDQLIQVAWDEGRRCALMLVAFAVSIMHLSQVSHNSAMYGGGISASTGANLTLRQSTVSGNRARVAYGVTGGGGGIVVTVLVPEIIRMVWLPASEM